MSSEPRRIAEWFSKLGSRWAIGLTMTFAIMVAAVTTLYGLELTQADSVGLTAEGRVSDMLARLGGWSYLAAPAAMIVVSILPIPAEIPAVANGMVFGAAIGAAITWFGAVVGALISFELARRFGRPLGERFLPAATIGSADRLVRSAGWPGLLALRLVPAVAFTAINWGAGLTSLRRWTFAWTTAVGIIPGTLLFTFTGSGFATLYRMNSTAAILFVVLVLLVTWWTVLRFRRRPVRSVTGELKLPDF